MDFKKKGTNGNKNMNCTCRHSEENHADNEPKVCKENDCKCEHFIAENDYNLQIEKHSKYAKQMEKTIDQMAYVLDNIKYFRNLTDKQLAFQWWNHIEEWRWMNDEPLTISKFENLTEAGLLTRARRALKEQNKDRYGPFIPSIEDEKILKQWQLEEFFVERKK